MSLIVGLIVVLSVLLLPVIIYYSHGRRYDRVRPDPASIPDQSPVVLPVDGQLDDDDLISDLSDLSDTDTDSSQTTASFLLSAVKLFGFMERHVVDMLAEHVKERLCKAGEVIVEMDWAGQVDRSLYVVQTGSVELRAAYLHGGGGDMADSTGKRDVVTAALSELAANDTISSDGKVVHTIGPGGTISSLFSILNIFADTVTTIVDTPPIASSKKPPAMTARALTDCRLVMIPEEAFARLAREFPEAAAHITALVLTRFQRVTFLSLYRYLGLARELAAVENDINSDCVIEADGLNDVRMAAVKAILDRLQTNADTQLTDKLLSHLTITDYKDGQMIAEHGANNPGLFMVVKGVVEGRIHDTCIYTSRPGGLCGTLAAFLGHSSFIDIVSGCESTVAVLSRHGVQLLVKADPQVMFRLADRLLRRLSPLVRSIDLMLEWRHVKAGRPLFHQGDPIEGIHIVLHGRLLNRTKQWTYKQGDVVGASVWLTGGNRQRSTVIAQRDCELACLPLCLLDVMAQCFPSLVLNMSRRLAARHLPTLNASEQPPAPGKTVAVIPLGDRVPIRDFAERLCDNITTMGDTCQLLDSQSVMDALGKMCFSRMAKLKVYEFLSQQEDANRVVLLVGDGHQGSVWTRQCCRQADHVLFVVDDDDYNTIPNMMEKQIIRSMQRWQQTAQMWLVLLHKERLCHPGSTIKWLQRRPWIDLHFHVHWPSAAGDDTDTKPSIMNMVKQRLVPARPVPRASQVPSDDTNRLARHLVGRAVGVVLSGGGARGVAHVGALRALREAGIPVDVIGGTSMGAFVGALYASDGDWLTLPSRVRYFCDRAGSRWRQLGDLTWPYCAWFTGHSLNRALWKLFGAWMIDDLWLPYYCVTTDISTSRKAVHATTGAADDYVWRYVRASMSLSGLVPPVCDRHGHMHVDGGYVSTVPVDVLLAGDSDTASATHVKLQNGIGTVIVVDVSALTVDPGRYKIGDAVSGFWPAVQRLLGLPTTIPNLADIQTRIAFVSSDSATQRLCDDWVADPKVMLIRPPVQHLSILDFGKHGEATRIGFEETVRRVEEWRAGGGKFPASVGGSGIRRRRRSL